MQLGDLVHLRNSKTDLTKRWHNTLLPFSNNVSTVEGSADLTTSPHQLNFEFTSRLVAD